MTHELPVNALGRSIQPSATLAISARAGELRAAGRKVYNFAAGQPDFPPPASVTAALVKALEGSPVGYAPVPGLPALRDAVAVELGEYHGKSFERANVIVSCGAKHSLAGLFRVVVSPGDQAVIPAPYWVSYPQMVKLAGGDPVVVKTSPSSNLKLDAEGLAAAVNVKTRLVVLNSPSNPTGVAYDRAQLRALGEVLSEKAPQAWVVLDDIYRKLTYGERGHVSFVRACEGLSVADQVVLIDGVSKSHAMTGYRIGFTVAPVPIVKAMTAIQGQTTSGATTTSQWAALAALTEPESIAAVATMREKFTQRRAAMLEGLTAAGVEFIAPDGAFYVFPDFNAFIGDGQRFSTDLELATFLLEEQGLATVPGSAFGTPGHLRMSFATGLDDIVGGMKALKAALAG